MEEEKMVEVDTVETVEEIREAVNETTVTKEPVGEADGKMEEPAVAEPKQASNALAYIALITGILAIVTLSMFPLAAMAAVVCGLVGERKCEKSGMAKAGAVLGAIGCAMGMVFGFLIGVSPFIAIIMAL